MQDLEKTKAELIEELKLLRQKVENQDSEGNNNTSQRVQRRQERFPFKTRIEFIGDFDIVEAQGVNISEGGMCFQISSELPFELRYEKDELVQQKRAILVWVRKSDNKGYLLGLRFTNPEPFPEL